MKKSLVPVILSIAAFSLCSCGNNQIDDIDLMYYAHHIEHKIWRSAKEADLIIKPFHQDTVDIFRFKNIAWLDEGYAWTGYCGDFDYSKYLPLDYEFGSILNDDLIRGFTKDLFSDFITFNDYYREGLTGLTDESQYVGRIAYLESNKLTLITQWNVLSYSSKTEPTEGDGEDEVKYEDLRSMVAVEERVFDKEKLDYHRITLCYKGYFAPSDDGTATSNKEYKNKDNCIDYYEYKVSFF